MAVRILVIQFRSDDVGIKAEHQVLERALGRRAEFVFKNALKNEVDWNDPEGELKDFDGIILPGSAELYFDGGHHEAHEGRIVTNKLAEEGRQFFRYLIEQNFPTLGICFGHQLLAYAAGADIRHSKIEGKTGTEKVRVLPEGEADPLLEGLPEEFPAQYTHKDVVHELPPGSTVLACHPDKCRFSVLRFASSVYSVQFHPERTRDDCIAGLKRTPEYAPERAIAEELFQDSKESERIMDNFVDIAGRKKFVAQSTGVMAVAGDTVDF